MPRRIGLNRRSDLQRSPRFKAAVALAAIKGDRTTAELATAYRIDESVIDLWKKQVLAALPEVFAAAGQSDRSAHHDLKAALRREIRLVQSALDALEKKAVELQ